MESRSGRRSVVQKRQARDRRQQTTASEILWVRSYPTWVRARRFGTAQQAPVDHARRGTTTLVEGAVSRVAFGAPAHIASHRLKAGRWRERGARPHPPKPF